VYPSVTQEDTVLRSNSQYKINVYYNIKFVKLCTYNNVELTHHHSTRS